MTILHFALEPEQEENASKKKKKRKLDADDTIEDADENVDTPSKKKRKKGMSIGLAACTIFLYVLFVPGHYLCTHLLVLLSSEDCKIPLRN